MAGRYLSLYTYLEHRYASNVVLTFEQMESLLGCALPTPARSERDWWKSPTDDLDHHSDAWIGGVPHGDAESVGADRRVRASPVIAQTG